jgi:integrase
MSLKVRQRLRGGKRAWYVDVSGTLPDGRYVRREKRAPIQTRKDAEAFGRELERQVLSGKYGKLSPKLSDFWRDTYRPWTDNNTKPASAKAVEIAFRVHVLPLLGDRRLGDIGPTEVEQLKGALLKDKKAPKTVNNVLGYLHRGLTLAVEHGLLERVPGVGLLDVEDTEAEWLEPEEQGRFLRACDYWPERAPLLACLLETGLRIGECLALRNRDIDHARNVLFVRRTRVAVDGSFGRPKEGPSREVHLSVRAAECLGTSRSLRELVFTSVDGKPLTHAMVRDWVSDAAKKAGIAKHVTAHSLRHTRTANMVMAGVDERTVMAELGWTTPSMVRRYAHLAPSHRRDAVEKVEAFLSGAKKKVEHDE